MHAKLCLLVVVAIVGVIAQPQGERRYLPPGQEQGNGRAPSSQYGAPSNGANRNGGQSSASRSGAPNSQYGVPSNGVSRVGGQSAGKPSGQYEAPVNGASRFGGQSSGSRSGSPSSQYGAPSNGASKFGGQSSGSRSGSPSSQYGAPAIGAGRFGAQASNAPSKQYNAPAGGQNGGQFNGYSDTRGNANEQDDAQSEPANYEFSWEVQDDESGNNYGHQESREGDETKGSYHVLLPDGRTQIVDYVANAEGYMPTIRYEEAQGGQGGQGGYAASGSNQGGNQGGYAASGNRGNQQDGYRY